MIYIYIYVDIDDDALKRNSLHALQKTHRHEQVQGFPLSLFHALHYKNPWLRT